MKRLIASLLMICLLVGLLPALPVETQAAEVAATGSGLLWTDFAADGFEGGDGSEESPFQIATAEQLAYLALRANSGIQYFTYYFMLVDNIDLSGYAWEPICVDETKRFCGTFDGKGYTISGLTLTDDSVINGLCGLFGYADNNIQNLNLTDVQIQLTDRAFMDSANTGADIGSLVGYHKGTIENVTVTGCLSITNSSQNVTVSPNFGGIVGLSETDITNCSFSGNIYVSGADYPSVGGISAYATGTYRITTNCYSEGSIVIDGAYRSTQMAEVGGICGQSLANFQYCYSDMDITLKSVYGYAGGLVGINIGKQVICCYASGTIIGEFASSSSTSYSHHVGGLIGRWDAGAIYNCYTVNPSITCTKANAQQETHAGKLVGYIKSGNTATVSNSYVSTETTLKRNGFQSGGDCDANSYPIVNAANSTYSEPETDAFTYSKDFLVNTLGWDTQFWIIGNDRAALNWESYQTLTIRYINQSGEIFQVYYGIYNRSSYSVTSPEVYGETPDIFVLEGTLTEDRTYFTVRYYHMHMPGSEPTCSRPQICVLCGMVLVEPLEHMFGTPDEVPPSCVENGYSLRTCTSCNQELKTDFVPPLGHDLDLSNRCKRCGIVFENPLRDFRVHVLDQESGSPLENALVTLGGFTVSTDEEGIASYQLDSQDAMALSVKVEGYPDYEISDFLPGELPDSYVFVTSSDTGIYDARCNDKDVLQSSAQVNALAPTLEAKVVIKGRSKADITHYELVQDNAIIATSTDGVFSVRNLYFRQRTPVYARMHTTGPEGSNVFSQKLNINVVGFNLDASTDWGKLLPFAFGLDISFPNGTPILEGMNFKIPASFLGKNGFVKVQVGNEKLMVTLGDKADFNEKEEDLDKKTKSQLLRQMRDDWIKRNNPKAWPEGKKENEVTASVGIVIEFSETGVTSVYGQVNVAYDLSYTNGKTFMIWFIPIYAEISASFGGNLQVTDLGYDIQNAQILVPDVELSLNGQITLREGLGCSVLSAGVYGTAGAYLVLGVEDLQEYLTYRIYGELGLYARLKLFFWKAMECRLPLLQGEFSGSAGRARQALYALEAYETVSRDYLKNRSSWLTSLAKSSGVAQNVTMQTSSYTAIEPRIITCGDTVMMVFADDDGSEGLNYQHLYYSLYQKNTGLWSQPQKLDTNDLCDLEFDICTDGQNIWILYTQMGSVTQDNQDNYEDLLSTAEVTAAVYDPETAQFTYHTLTNDETFDSQPQIAVTKDGIQAAWISNTTNDPFSQNANNRIVSACFRDGHWSENVALTQSGATVVSMDLGMLQDSTFVATVVDVDCDLSTIEDRQVVLTDLSGTVTTVATQKNTNESVQFGVLDGKQCLLWYQESNLYCIYSPDDAPTALFAEPVEGLSADYRLITLDQYQQAIVYTAPQRWTTNSGVAQSGSNLQAIFFQNGTWSEPISLTEPENDRYVEAYDVQVLNGKLLVPYISMKADVSSTDIQRVANFRSSYITIPSDLVVGEAIYLPSTLVTEEPIELKVPFTNHSIYPVQQVTYRITDLQGRLVMDGTLQVSVGAGEEGWATILLPHSLLTTAKNYQITILPDPWTDEDLSNNSTSLDLRYSDLSVSLGQLLVNDQQVQYAVTNEGNATARGTLVLHVLDEDGNKTKLEEIRITDLAPGKSIHGMIQVDQDLCNNHRVILATVTSNTPDLYDFNNEAKLTLMPLVRETLTEVPQEQMAVISPQLSAQHVVYDQRSGGSVSITITKNGWSLNSIAGCISGGYTYSSNTLVLSEQWLRSLNTGYTNLLLGFQQGDHFTKLSVILEVINSEPTEAEISAVDQVIPYADHAPMLGLDVVYTTNSQGAITASYAQNDNGPWTPGLPTEVGIYRIRLQVAEDTANNLTEGTCYFTLEIIKGTRAISLPKVTRLENGDYQFDGAQPTAGIGDGVITYGYSTVNDPATVPQWSSVGLIPDPDSSVQYYLFARITDSTSYQDAYSTGLSLSIHVHSYEATVTEPECEAAGYTTYRCTGCQDQYVDAQVPALGHSFTNYVSDNNADCLQDGTQTAVCDRCDVTDTQVLPGSATGHQYDSGVVLQEPTCIQDGLWVYTCSCGDQYTLPLPSLKHSFTNYVSDNNATCLQDGTQTAVCDRCDVTDTQVLPGSATGHQYDSGVVLQEPTCIQDGLWVYTCSCGDQYTVPVPSLGHSFTNYVSDNNAACLQDGTQTAVCDRCDVTDTQVLPGSATGHQYDSGVVIRDATCIEDGLVRFTCRCGDQYTVPVPPLGHCFSCYIMDGNATCNQDGTKTAQCDRCPVTDTIIDVGSAMEHWYVATEIIPTCLEDGYVIQNCSNCGDSFVDHIIPATGHEYLNGCCIRCNDLQPGYARYTGSIQSFGEPEETVYLELTPVGSTMAAYGSMVHGNTGGFEFIGVVPGEYTLAIHKKNHVTRYFTVSLQAGDNREVQSLKIYLLGDVSGDGRVNVGDVAQLYGHIRKTNLLTDEYALACADVTGDGRLNVGDTATLYSHGKNTIKLY